MFPTADKHERNRSPLSTIGSSLSSGSLTSTVNVGGVSAKLWNSNAERDQHENYASLYAIVKATEALEKVYTKDIINKNEYAILKPFAAFFNLLTKCNWLTHLLWFIEATKRSALSSSHNSAALSSWPASRT